MNLDRIVTNSACLIGLERIGRLDLLPQVYPTLLAPTAVQTEVGINPSWLQIQTVTNSALVTTLRTQIGAGESEAIALALELNQLPVLLDDKKARRIAQQLGLTVIGTVGTLLRAKQQGAIAEIEPILTALEQANFRIARPLRQRALQLAGEL